MDIVTTSLEALIQRATCNQNQCRDTAAIDAFCGLVCKEPDCAQTATRFITAKIHSLHEWEALQALHVLDVCMKRCGSDFHAEVGKFRFLNELIKLVSPKYNGAHTPEPVKRRVLELMQSWTVYYPRELKIKEAYDMLKKQGVVKEETFTVVCEPHKSLDQNITPVPSRHQDSIFQDTEKSRLLQKLLQSKNPDDLQAANKLIKTMVKEDERRVEMKSRHLSELEAAHNNARLLSEMLTSYNRDTSSSQDLELITELHASCLRYQPNVQKLLSEVHKDERLFNEVLAANDELSEVLEKYSAVIVRGVSATSVGSNLLDLSTPSEETLTLNTSVPLLTDSLITTGLDSSLPSSEETGFAPPSFSQAHPILTQPLAPLSQPSTTLAQTFAIPPQPLATFTPQPLSDLTSLGDIFGPPPPVPTSLLKSGTERATVKTGLEELDALSESLLRQSLPQPTALNTGKVPMNQLSLSHQSSPAHSLLNSLDSISLPASDPKCEDLLIDSTDNLISESTQINGDVPLAESPPLNASISKTVEKTERDIPVKNESSAVKPLGDITVPLDTIKPGNLSPLTVLEERGVSVTIHFGLNSPRPDISVFVVTTTSKSQYPITDYLFQAIVPKCCRLRLQPPSSTELPAHNPFLPPAAITQVMLIGSPNKEAISLRVVVSFTMDDETVTEMKELERFPVLIS